ncbi:MAG: NACHT domain-containing protein [Candidatus Lokiarchaeota archaeon]|nr:NACHT domain-containing protein [Candidatus Lokiarchaeota archaeon]
MGQQNGNGNQDSLNFKTIIFKLLLSALPYSLIAIDSFERFIKEYPFVSLFIYTIYLLFVFIFSILKEILKKTKETVINTFSKRIHDPVEYYCQSVFSGFFKRYIQNLKANHSFFNVQGMSVQSPYLLKLQDVFIDLELTFYHRKRREKDEFKTEIWTLLEKDDPEFRILMLIGKPGSGKTTLLQYITLRLALRDTPVKKKRYIPVLLQFKSFAKEISSNKGRDKTLAEIIQNDAKQLEPPKFWFQRQFHKNKNKCIVMLDGLDEVADQKEREQVYNWVKKQTELYHSVKFIITSRPHGYHSMINYESELKATILELIDFDFKQIHTFVHNWYSSVEVLAAGLKKKGLEIQVHAKNKAQDLFQRITKSEALSKLAINPLLLTMITMVHRFIGDLPERRAALYADICKVLLSRRMETEIRGVKLGIYQKLFLLQILAMNMMIRGKQEISYETVAEILRTSLESLNLKPENSREIIEAIMRETGFLIEVDKEHIQFSHKTYQEYLAAAEIKESKRNNIIVERVGESWWHETILLYSAIADATEIVKQCLNSTGNRLEKLKLAYEISLEALRIEPDTRRRLEKELLTEIDSHESEKRKMAADLIFEIRLKKMVRLSDDTEIDPFMVSQVEYQDFIDETNNRPDQWRAFSYPKGEGLKPIRGIRYADALEFTRWLNNKARRLGHFKSSFRLATEDELKQVSINEDDSDPNFKFLANNRIGYWIHDKQFLFGSNTELTNEFNEKFANAMSHEIQRYPEYHPTLLHLLELLHQKLSSLGKKFDDIYNMLIRKDSEELLKRLPVEVDQFLGEINEIKKLKSKLSNNAQKLSYPIEIDKTHLEKLEQQLIELSRLQYSKVGYNSYQPSDISVIERHLSASINQLSLMKNEVHNYQNQFARHSHDFVLQLEQSSVFYLKKPVDLEQSLDFLNKIDKNKFEIDDIELVRDRKISKNYTNAKHQLLTLAEHYLYTNQEEHLKKTLQAFWCVFIIKMRSYNRLPAFEGIRLAREIHKD